MSNRERAMIDAATTILVKDGLGQTILAGAAVAGSSQKANPKTKVKTRVKKVIGNEGLTELHACVFRRTAQSKQKEKLMLKYLSHF